MRCMRLFLTTSPKALGQVILGRIMSVVTMPFLSAPMRNNSYFTQMLTQEIYVMVGVIRLTTTVQMRILNTMDSIMMV